MDDVVPAQAGASGNNNLKSPPARGRRPLRATLRRWHVWLGWIVGLPLLFWTVSGLVMVWKPIDEVRGSDLLLPLDPVTLTAPAVLPSQVAGLPLAKVSLESRAAGPRWIIEVRNGPTRIADPVTGRLLPSPSAADASAEVMRRYTGDARIASVERTAADAPPIELRRPIATWQVNLSDGTHVFVDAATGGVVATRTRWWRFYDWMFGLHVMDLDTHEDTHHPLLIGFAIFSLVTVVLALFLLPLVIRRRRA